MMLHSTRLPGTTRASHVYVTYVSTVTMIDCRAVVVRLWSFSQLNSIHVLLKILILSRW